MNTLIILVVHGKLEDKAVSKILPPMGNCLEVCKREMF